MRIIYLSLIAAAAISLSFFKFSADDNNPLAEFDADFQGTVLVQLFTSQGCSSCPPADKLLETVKNQDDQIFVLSYHVDYWDRLGWKDPFSKPQFSRLQYTYGKKFGGRSVYTPQAVLNGAEHFVGSNKAKMTRLLEEHKLRGDANKLVLSEAQDKDGLTSISFEVDGPVEGKTLKIALVLDRETTFVSRGENRSRTLVNHNIVLEEKEKVIPLEKMGSVTFNLEEYTSEGQKLHVIGYIQSEDLTISGAHKLSL